MMKREDIYKIIKDYLPNAEESLLTNLTLQAEKQISLAGKDIIRQLVLRKVDREFVTGLSRIDTKA